MRLLKKDLLLKEVQCLQTMPDSPHILKMVGETIHRQARRVLTILSVQLLLTALSAELDDLAISIPELLGVKAHLLPVILVMYRETERRGRTITQITALSVRSLPRLQETVQ